MKRNFILLCYFLWFLPTLAQNTITVHQKDGQQFSLGFNDKPVVTYNDNELIVKTDKTELRCALTNVAKFTFDDVEDAVINIKTDLSKTSISLDENNVSITGAKANITVRLLASDGKQLQSYETDKDGTVTFSISDLSEGTYIVTSDSLTIKILKK